MALHKHKCENSQCGIIFEHEVPNTSGMSEEEGEKFYADGHMCPECKTGPYTLIHFDTAEEKRSHREKIAKRDPFFQLLSIFVGQDKLMEEINQRLDSLG